MGIKNNRSPQLRCDLMRLLLAGVGRSAYIMQGGAGARGPLGTKRSRGGHSLL